MVDSLLQFDDEWLERFREDLEMDVEVHRVEKMLYIIKA